MPKRVQELLRRIPEPEPETTAPIAVKLRSVALVVIAAASTVALLYWAREVFIPIVLSVLMSYALQPIVTLLVRAHLARCGAIILRPARSSRCRGPLTSSRGRRTKPGPATRSRLASSACRSKSRASTSVAI